MMASSRVKIHLSVFDSLFVSYRVHFYLFLATGDVCNFNFVCAGVNAHVNTGLKKKKKFIFI